MTVLTFHSLAAENPVNLEAFTTDEDGVELVVDTLDELVFLKDALGDIVHNRHMTPHGDDDMAVRAEELRNQILDDVTEMQIHSSDKLLPVTYEVEEPQLVVEAVKLHRQLTRELEEIVVRYPEFDWLSDPGDTHEAAVLARAYSSDEYKKHFTED